MAGGIDWFRWHHGSVTDPKFQLVARKSKQALPSVIAVWAFVLEQASAAEQRGTYDGIDCEAIDCLMGLNDGATAAILAVMAERGLLDDGQVCSWEKRQPKRERIDTNSTERSRTFREKQRHATPEEAEATPRNATQRQKTPRGEESREEEISPLPPVGGFEDFWKCWPVNDRKQDRGKCLAKWKREGFEAVSAQILADVQAKKLSKKWVEGFVETPLVYLNNRRWEDGAAAGNNPSPKGDIDAYCAAHRTATWWAEAGFANVYEATSSKCFHHNAAQFRDGKKLETA